MKITRTYFSGCTWCNATGFVYYTTPLTHPCPVCNGSKIIQVVETLDDNYILPHDKPVESLENPK
jgi:hypothetical protein